MASLVAKNHVFRYKTAAKTHFGGRMGWQMGYRANDTIEDRFFRLVEKTAGCWLWQGNISHSGYGRLQFNKARILAHRVSYEIHKGALPAGSGVCHSCDNPRCVNPKHLFAGDQKVNMGDCATKMRHTFGEKIKHAVLTNRDVRRMRSLYESGALNQRQLAEKYGVSRGHVGLIVQRKRWPYT